MKKQIAVVGLALALVGSAVPAHGHVQTKTDAENDTEALLDLEQAEFWHEDGRLFFMVKTYAPWQNNDFAGRWLDVNMNTYGDGYTDYMISVRRPRSAPDSEVRAYLIDTAADAGMGTVRMERPTRRKVVFSFRASRITIRAAFFKWRVISGEAPVAPKFGGTGGPCDSGCFDYMPDASGWYRHRL